MLNHKGFTANEAHDILDSIQPQIVRLPIGWKILEQIESQITIELWYLKFKRK
jgi:hypothetical protein